MSTQAQQIEARINEMVFESHGVKMIALGNYALDFKANFVYLGMTKNKNKVILGDIHTMGPDGVKYLKKFGKLEERTREEFTGKGTESRTVKYIELSTDGHRYSERIMEIEN